jgi:hypothetical protein
MTVHYKCHLHPQSQRAVESAISDKVDELMAHYYSLASPEGWCKLPAPEVIVTCVAGNLEAWAYTRLRILDVATAKPLELWETENSLHIYTEKDLISLPIPSWVITDCPSGHGEDYPISVWMTRKEAMTEASGFAFALGQAVAKPE